MITVSSVRIAVTTNEPRALILFVLGGGLLLYLVITHLARLGKVALRADSRGITFGGKAFRYRETTHVVPWPAIRAVVVYRTHGYRVQGSGGVTGRFLGLRGTDLHQDPLTEAVRRFAPEVGVVDAG